MYDLVITGGTLATESSTARGDLGIRGGRIATVSDDLTGAPARDRQDATGKLVLPGGIEAHAHIAQESAAGIMTADDYESGSRSAAAGGNSCFVPFAAQHRGMGVTETLDLYDSRAAGCSYIDYSYHLIVTDPTEAVLREELPAAFARGVTSFKVFMTYERMKIDDTAFLEILAVARAHGALTMVHAENNAMIDWVSGRLLEAGRTAPRYHAVSHPALAEEEAIHRAICLSRLVDAPLFIVHVSTPEGAELVARAQARGARVFAETCPQYLFLTREDLDRPGMEGAKFMCSPPVRDRATQAALWEHLRQGTFASLSSDHAPYRFDETGKLANGPEAGFKKIANGMPGIAARLPLLFSEGVAMGRITLQQFVALSAANAARLYGMPQKGTLAPGADADIAIWDPGARRRLELADLADAMDYTPYEGMEVTGWPVAVFSRGEAIVEEGRIVGRPGQGRFIKRGVPDLGSVPGGLPPELDPAQNFGAEIL